MELAKLTASSKQGERPDPDWPATGLLLIAQLQLDQMLSVLKSGLGIDARLFTGSEVTRRLRNAILSVRGGERAVEDFGLEIDAIGEAVDLWRVLRESPDLRITHTFEPDGSITHTLGPALPELSTLCIEATNGGELNADPAQIFSVAVACTMDVAELAVRFRAWSREGYVHSVHVTERVIDPGGRGPQ